VKSNVWVAAEAVDADTDTTPVITHSTAAVVPRRRCGTRIELLDIRGLVFKTTSAADRALGASIPVAVCDWPLVASRRELTKARAAEKRSGSMSEPDTGVGDSSQAADEQPELREERAYLLKSRMNPFPVRGELELTSTKLRFTLGTMAGEAVVGWLEEELSDPDLKQRLRAGEAIVAFELDRDSLQVSWPKQFMGAGIKVATPGGREWLVSLVYPSNQYYTLYKTLTGRSRFKQWKRALASATTD
jgi:hypothetical protein